MYTGRSSDMSLENKTIEINLGTLNLKEIYTLGKILHKSLNDHEDEVNAIAFQELEEHENLRRE